MSMSKEILIYLIPGYIRLKWSEKSDLASKLALYMALNIVKSPYTDLKPKVI